MRIIDADKLIEQIKKTYCERCDNYNGMRCKACPNEDEIRDIDSAPTIDAESVGRGEWKPNPKIGWGETWVCSICGEKTTSSFMGYPRYNYCPMCGAKMYGEREGE